MIQNDYDKGLADNFSFDRVYVKSCNTYIEAYGSKPKKHSKRMTGRKQSDEHKARRSESLKRYWANKRSERRTDG